MTEKSQVQHNCYSILFPEAQDPLSEVSCAFLPKMKRM